MNQKLAQEIMDKFDSTIRIEFQFTHSAAEIMAFDTTIVPNHVNIWRSENTSQESVTFTHDYAKSIADYWAQKRHYR